MGKWNCKARSADRRCTAGVLDDPVRELGHGSLERGIHGSRVVMIRVALGLCGVGTWLAPATVHAGQDASPSVSEVVVTARRRAESVQDIPVVVNAIDMQALERAGVQNLWDIVALTPGLQVLSGGGKLFDQPAIRGLSPLSVLADDPNVATFVDGVYVSGRNALNFNVLDLERVEVVKGPQNSLYGRQAFSGAMNFITRKPGSTLQAHAGVDLGSGAKTRGIASVSGPLLGTTLGGRIALLYDDFGGTYRDSASGRRLGGYRTNGVSGTLRLTPGDAWDFVLTSAYDDDDVGHNLQVIHPANCQAVAGGPNQLFCGQMRRVDGAIAFDPRAYGLKRETTRSSLTVTWEPTSALRVVSLSGFNSVSSDPLNDADRQLPGLAFPLRDAVTGAAAGSITATTFNPGGVTSTGEFMQDVRIESASQSALQWLAGVSYYNFHESNQGRFAVDSSAVPAGRTIATVLPTAPVAGGSLGGDLPLTSFARRNTEAYSAYGALEYAFNGSWRARGELRYQEETKRINDVVPSRPQRSADFRFWTPRLSLDYRPGEGALWYASVARGAVSGGFNAATLPLEIQVFDSAFNWTYEMGAKTTWLDRRVTANLGLFYVDFTGMQILTRVPTSIGIVFGTQNAGSASSRGAELELSVIPIRGMKVGLNYVYADSKFDRAVDSSLRSFPAFAADQDVSGNPLPNASKHTGTFSIEFDRPLGGEWTAYGRSDVSYSSRRYGFTSPVLGWVGDRTVANLRVGATRGPIDVSAWSRNLFDDRTPLQSGSILLVNTFLTQPTVVLAQGRTYGVSLSYRY